MSETVKTKEVYALMKAFVEAGLADKAVKKCNAIYQFDILDKPQGKKVFSFWIDVTEAGQKVGEGDHAKPDATFEVSDEDFFKMCNGKLNPQMAFMNVRTVTILFIIFYILQIIIRITRVSCHFRFH